MTKTIEMGPTVKPKNSPMPVDENGEFHYFTSSAVGWAKDTNLLKCLKKQRSHDRSGGMRIKSFNLFAVPGPDTADYDIDFYCPEVEGTIYLQNVEY